MERKNETLSQKQEQKIEKNTAVTHNSDTQKSDSRKRVNRLKWKSLLSTNSNMMPKVAKTRYQKFVRYLR